MSEVAASARRVKGIFDSLERREADAVVVQRTFSASSLSRMARLRARQLLGSPEEVTSTAPSSVRYRALVERLKTQDNERKGVGETKNTDDTRRSAGEGDRPGRGEDSDIRYPQLPLPMVNAYARGTCIPPSSLSSYSHSSTSHVAAAAGAPAVDLPLAVAATAATAATSAGWFTHPAAAARDLPVLGPADDVAMQHLARGGVMAMTLRSSL